MALLVVATLWLRAPWADALLKRNAEGFAILTAVAVAYATAFVLRAAAWRLLLVTPVHLGALVRNLHLSLVLNHLLPVKAGEVSRPLLAARRGVPLPEAVASMLAARVMDLLCLALLAVALMPVHRAISASALGALALGTAVLLLARGRTGTRLLARTLSHVPHRVSTRVQATSSALAAIPVGHLALAVPIVLVSWVLEASVLLGAASLLDIELGVRVAVAATAFTILFQVVHVTPGGLGVYEATMTSVLVAHGIEAETALGIAVLTHALKFAYAFSVGSVLSVSEVVVLLGGRPGEAPRAATRVEVIAARLWNVLNEGKPFTPVFAAGVAFLLVLPDVASPEAWLAATVALVAVAPLALVFWRLDFPLRLRAMLWMALGALLLVTGRPPLLPVTLVVGLYLFFTVVLWGAVYYHLRIGTPWSNGFRFARLVAENPDPTSGNLLEQLPKLLLLVLAFEGVRADPSGHAVAASWGFAALLGLLGLVAYQWWFTWVPVQPQRRIAVDGAPPVTPREARRVIAIVIDGCRADRLAEAATPCLDRLRAGGTDVRAMSTVYPARTVVGFSSMLTGAPPSVHRMGSNFVPDLGVKCPSVFDVLRDAGQRGRLVGIAHLIDAFGPHDVRSVTAVMDNDAIDGALITEAQRVLAEEDPDLLVLQLLSVDQTGHARGSYNAEYLAKIEEADRTIEVFLAWCEARGYLDGTTVIVTADHGQGIGIGGHGHMSPSEARIPCILWGAGVAACEVVESPTSIMDVAPTITGLLGLPAPAASVGRDLRAPSPVAADGPVVFIVPACNEEENLPSVLDAIARSGVQGRRVVVVDDGSTDRTASVAEAAGATVVAHGHRRGLGAAVRTGLEAARGLDARAVVYLDADGEYDAREAPALLAPIEAGEADYVLGSRFQGRPEGMTASRRLANYAFSGLLSLLCCRRISDGQTGFRAFSSSALAVAEVVHDYNYAQVLTLDLQRKGMRMCEVPISYRRRRSGRSFVSAEYLWRVPLGMAREMVRP